MKTEAMKVVEDEIHLISKTLSNIRYNTSKINIYLST